MHKWSLPYEKTIPPDPDVICWENLLGSPLEIRITENIGTCSFGPDTIDSTFTTDTTQLGPPWCLLGTTDGTLSELMFRGVIQLSNVSQIEHNSKMLIVGLDSSRDQWPLTNRWFRTSPQPRRRTFVLTTFQFREKNNNPPSVLRLPWQRPFGLRM